MILGTACSAASIIMGEIAQRNLNLTQVRSHYCVIVVGNDNSAWLRYLSNHMHIAEKLCVHLSATLQKIDEKTYTKIQRYKFLKNALLPGFEPTIPPLLVTHPTSSATFL